ncbi:hypothetical protein [Aeromonas sp. S19(2024)]|uniref:hypothetical protein n=1 Tax=Aeromonas sp. S19(2024) TaxID=3242892 RepID=UPI0035297B38
MSKFLYLSEYSYCHPWVNGGSIPIFLASKYISTKRDGIYTPDENLIHEGEYPIDKLKNHGFYFEEVRDLTMTGCIGNGFRIPNIRNANYYHDDGLILSFCNHFDPAIAKKLNKKACVEILSINKLKNHISRKLKQECIAKNCEYTENHERNHFLKSIEDSWQNEFRLFWKAEQNATVHIPKGIARIVRLPK